MTFQFRLTLHFNQSELLKPQDAVLELCQSETLSFCDEYFAPQHFIFGVRVSFELQLVHKDHISFHDVESHRNTFSLWIHVLDRINLRIKIPAVRIQLLYVRNTLFSCRGCVHITFLKLDHFS